VFIEGLSTIHDPLQQDYAAAIPRAARSKWHAARRVRPFVDSEGFTGFSEWDTVSLSLEQDVSARIGIAKNNADNDLKAQAQQAKEDAAKARQEAIDAKGGNVPVYAIDKERFDAVYDYGECNRPRHDGCSSCQADRHSC
jgi:hypothetical protein